MNATIEKIILLEMSEELRQRVSDRKLALKMKEAGGLNFISRWLVRKELKRADALIKILGEDDFSIEGLNKFKRKYPLFGRGLIGGLGGLIKNFLSKLKTETEAWRLDESEIEEQTINPGLASISMGANRLEPKPKEEAEEEEVQAQEAKKEVNSEFVEVSIEETKGNIKLGRRL